MQLAPPRFFFGEPRGGQYYYQVQPGQNYYQVQRGWW
jgi:hypothetical protein